MAPALSKNVRLALTYAALSAIAVTMLLPSLWMVLATSKPLAEVERTNP